MDKKGLNDRIQRQEADWRKERDQLIGRATDLEVEIKVILLHSIPSSLSDKKVVRF